MRNGYPLFSLNASHLIPPDQLLPAQHNILRSILEKITDLTRYRRSINEIMAKHNRGFGAPRLPASPADYDGEDTLLRRKTLHDYEMYLKRHRPHQVFTICGGRGTGKTSVLYSLEYLLSPPERRMILERMYDEFLDVNAAQLKEKLKSALNELESWRFLILPIIFPSELEGLKQATLEAIVSQIDKHLDHALSMNRPSRSEAAIHQDMEHQAFQSLQRKLRKDLGTGWLFAREDGTGLKTLANDSVSFEDFADQRLTYVRKGFERVETWRLFIDEFLDAMGFDFMVVLFDDTDLLPQVSKDMLTTIRIYLNHPRIITIVAADCVHLRREIIRVNLKENLWENCHRFLEAGAGTSRHIERHDIDLSDSITEKTFNFVRRETDDFLYKVLPLEGRHYIHFDTKNDCRFLFTELLKEETDCYGDDDTWSDQQAHALANWLPVSAEEAKQLLSGQVENNSSSHRHSARQSDFGGDHEGIDENLFLAAIDTPASRLMAFRRTAEWCWLGRSPREVISSGRKLIAFLRSLKKEERENPAWLKRENIDRDLLHIIGQRPAASRVALIPGLGNLDLSVIERMMRRHTLCISDSEMTYVIDAQETPIGADMRIRTKDNGFFFLTLLLDTALQHAHDPSKPYPKFPLCKLLHGLERKNRPGGPPEQHPEAEYFNTLREEWKRQGLLRGIGGIDIEGLEAMPAPVMHLADLAHLTIEGFGVSCNTLYSGSDRYDEWLYELREGESGKTIPLSDAEHAALKKLAARDAYRELMIRRLIAMLCIDKGKGDQIKHIIDFIKKPEATQTPPLGNPGDGDLGRNADGKSCMVLKRCRIMLAWGLAAIFEEELRARGWTRDMKTVMRWLNEVKNKDLRIRQREATPATKKRHVFTTGDLPLTAIKERINSLQRLKDSPHLQPLEPRSIWDKVLCTVQRHDEFQKLVRAHQVESSG